MSVDHTLQPVDPFAHGEADVAVAVDCAACEKVAELIKSMRVPEDREESSLPGVPRELVGNFYLALVAVCHQTSPRGYPPLEGTVGDRHLRGWDYLFARLEQAANSDPEWLSPAFWSKLTGETVRATFRDAKLGDLLRCPELRAELLRDLGHGMVRSGWTRADEFYRQCGGRVAIGSPNLLETLSRFRAFRDPVQKKSVFLLALMRNSGIWRYVDNESVGPPVDYHEVRGHLRLGTVRFLDETLRAKVLKEEQVSPEQDISIRAAVFDAISFISRRSGLHNPSQLHYLFWNLFRSICTRERPQCFQLSGENTLPARYRDILKAPLVRCPFSLLCPSAGSVRPICEHVFETDFY